MKTLALLTLALLACSKSDDKAKPEATPTETPAVSCAEAITKAYDRMPAGPMASMLDKMKQVMTTRCNEDKWPKAVIDCYVAASTQPAMKACREQLPAEAKAKASAEIVKLMSSMGGAPGGGPPHGAPPSGGS